MKLDEIIKNADSEELVETIKDLSSHIVGVSLGINKNLTNEDVKSIPILGELEIVNQDDELHNFPKDTYIMTSYYTFTSNDEIGENKISVAFRPDNSICIRKDTTSLLKDYRKYEEAKENECIYSFTDITEINLEGTPSIAHKCKTKYRTYNEYLKSLENNKDVINNIGDFKEEPNIHIIKPNKYLNEITDIYRKIANELNKRIRDERLIRLCIGM